MCCSTHTGLLIHRQLTSSRRRLELSLDVFYKGHVDRHTQRENILGMMKHETQ